MTQEYKSLLLKDLCGRLPYEVILLSPNGKVTYQTDGNTAAELLVEEGWKPYLRPMSSMTEEEEKEYKTISIWGEVRESKVHYTDICPTIEGYDWLNKNMFDYRDLIGKGLAVEVTKENNPYEA